MEFEYDLKKSQSNKARHGIDFNEAQALWEDSRRIEIQALTTDEPRFVVIGKIDNKHWSAIITYRKNKIRIISMRRARKNEVELYES
ncbi:MAG: BrnT family toxin [Pleurocapsa sp.]